MKYLTHIGATCTLAALLGAALTGCSTSTSDACGQLGEAVRVSTDVVVNQAATLPADPQGVLAAFDAAQQIFDEQREDWPEDVSLAADTFETEFAIFRDEMDAALSTEPIDGEAITAAASKFESHVQDAMAFCATDTRL